MSIEAALLVVGLLDALVGALFWRAYRRAAQVLSTWPDPGPWGAEKPKYDQLHSLVENYRVLRIVCLNTGASMVCTALMIFTTGVG